MKSEVVENGENEEEQGYDDNENEDGGNLSLEQKKIVNTACAECVTKRDDYF